MSEQIPTTALIELPKSVTISSTIDTMQKVTEPEIKTSKSETISSTIESHETETKSEQKFHMKLEHKTPSIMESKPRIEQKTIATKKIDRDKENVTKPLIKTEEKSTINNENIETSTIVKKDALSFFESITKESEIMPKGPKEMIKLTEEELQGAKVGKLTKNYEQATIYQETKKPEVRSSDLQTMKKAAQDIFTKLEQGSSSRGVENKLFEFPYESSKLPSMEVKKTVEEKTFVDSSISQLQNQTENFKMMMKSFDLVPEPPPEICYMPKPEEKKKRPDVFVKAKQLQESFDKTLSPIDAPIGGVKIFPMSISKVTEPVKAAEPVLPVTIPPLFDLEKKETFEETCIRKKDTYEKKESKYFKEEKMEPWRYASTSILRSNSPIRPWSSSSDVETKSHVSTDLSEYRCHSAASSQQEILRPTSPKPSADALAMEKSWAKKCVESNRKSWPPQTKPIQKWNVPIEEYRGSSKEFQQKIEEIPQGIIKKISTESSANVEKQSWCTKEEFTEKIIEASPPTKLGPIIYNAETIKVDHTINTVQEKALFEKYITECNMKKSETTQKSEDFSSKRWTEDKELKAPSLVKRIEPTTKSLPTSHRLMETEIDSIAIKPGSPPEIGYISSSFAKEKTRLEHTTTVEERVEEPPILPPKDVRITPPSVPAKKPVKFSTPLPSKFVKGSFSHESDYESDFDSRPKAKWRPYESDNEEPHYRRVKAPVPKQSTRPRSTEPEPLPPSKFETPAQFTEPSSLVTIEPSEKAARKIIFKRHEREVKQQQQQNLIPLKPGSPPIYVQPSTKSLVQKSSVKKPESPKFKTKVFQQESGYMADTDEPFQQKASSVTTQKFLGKHDGLSTIIHTESRTTENRTKSFESHNYETDHLQKDESSFVLPSICSAQATSKAVQQRSSLEKSYELATDSSNLRRFESMKVRDLMRVRVPFQMLFFNACLGNQ